MERSKKSLAFLRIQTNFNYYSTSTLTLSNIRTKGFDIIQFDLILNLFLRLLNIHISKQRPDSRINSPSTFVDTRTLNFSQTTHRIQLPERGNNYPDSDIEILIIHRSVVISGPGGGTYSNETPCNHLFDVSTGVTVVRRIFQNVHGRSVGPAVRGG